MGWVLGMGSWDGFLDSERFRLVIGTSIGSKKQIHKRRNVRIIPRIARTIVMPMVKFRSPNKPPQRTDRQADVRMDKNRPHSPEGNQSRDHMSRKRQQKDREIDQTNGINTIQRILAMSRQPIEMLRTMMHRMKAPEERNPMLQTMSPIDKKIA